MLTDKKITVLGLMSGSSLDGIDMALCEFDGKPGNLYWKIIQTQCIPMPASWKERLAQLPNGSARDLAMADYEFGYFLGDMCREHFGNHQVDFIASHGHTIFHAPEKGITCQIGNGATIAGRTGISVVSDFRSMDMAAGGQGAPIVSCLDRFVFMDYSVLANLGGIFNLSINSPDKTLAWDVCPCNQLLNHLASQKGFDFDPEGQMASKGRVSDELLKLLLNDPYYAMQSPKTLDNQYIVKRYFPLLDQFDCSVEDKLRTVVELIVQSVSNDVKPLLMPKPAPEDLPKILLAGGGAHNTFLVNQLRENLPFTDIVVPDKTLVDFKEAFLMAFLGYLRVIEHENTLASATGAGWNTIGGCVYKTGTNS